MHAHFKTLGFIGSTSLLVGSIAITSGCSGQQGTGVDGDRALNAPPSDHSVSMTAVRGSEPERDQDDMEQRIRRAVDERMHEMGDRMRAEFERREQDLVRRLQDELRDRSRQMMDSMRGEFMERMEERNHRIREMAEGFSHRMEEVHHALEEMRHGFGSAMEEMHHAFEERGHEYGRAMEEMGREIGHAFENQGRGFEEGMKEMGGAIEECFEKMHHGFEMLEELRGRIDEIECRAEEREHDEWEDDERDWDEHEDMGGEVEFDFGIDMSFDMDDRDGMRGNPRMQEQVRRVIMERFDEEFESQLRRQGTPMNREMREKIRDMMMDRMEQEFDRRMGGEDRGPKGKNRSNRRGNRGSRAIRAMQGSPEGFFEDAFELGIAVSDEEGLPFPPGEFPMLEMGEAIVSFSPEMIADLNLDPEMLSEFLVSTDDGSMVVIGTTTDPEVDKKKKQRKNKRKSKDSDKDRKKDKSEKDDS